MRVGTILEASTFDEARNPSYKLRIDFGEFGIKKSSAQITDLYSTQDLVGMQVVAVVNFPPKQIATMMSECLVLGALGGKGVSVLTSSQEVANGTKIA